MTDDLNSVCIEAFDREVIRELLLAQTDDVDDALVDKYVVLCKGNPWDAGILFLLVNMSKDAK